MNKFIFNTPCGSTAINIWLSILRIFSGVFMMTHGYPKLTKLLAGGEIAFPDPLGVGPTFSLILTVFSEFICAILVTLGLFTRLALIPLIFTMLVAAFVVHGSDPFGQREMSLMYLLVYLTLLIAGSGKYSLDGAFFGKKSS